MSNILNLIAITANFASIVLAFIGLFFVYKNWLIWKKVGMDIIKARAFLNKEFLEKNWLYVVAAGGLITIRRIYRFLELTTDIEQNQATEALFDVSGLVVILLLVLMAYQWYKLMHTHSFS